MVFIVEPKLHFYGRAVVQAASRWALSAEVFPVPFLLRFSGGHISTCAGSSASASFFPVTASFHQCSRPLVICILMLAGQSAEAQGTANICAPLVVGRVGYKGTFFFFNFNLHGAHARRTNVRSQGTFKNQRC